MPKTTIPTLGAVAEAQAEEKKKSKLAQAIGVLSAALGLGGEAKSAPAAKMTKRTVTTKRTEMEESDEDSEAEAEDSVADEDEESSTGSTGAESTGSTSPAAEDEDKDERAEDDDSDKEATYEEEEKALARAVSKALNSPAVHQAFLHALPAKYRDVGALYSPHRLASAAKKATGAQTSFGAMGALAEFTQKAKRSSEAVLSKQAKLEERVARVEGARRKERVDAIVLVAKERGAPGATTKEGRAMLRDYGMKFGTSALSKFIQSQGEGVRTRARLPVDSVGDVTGAPTTAEQKRMMEAAKVGLSKEQAARFDTIHADKQKALNGAGGPLS